MILLQYYLQLLRIAVYCSVNLKINPYYMACSVQVHLQNVFSLLMVNLITQADIITTKEKMPSTHAFVLEKWWLPNSVEQIIFSNRRWKNRSALSAVNVISSSASFYCNAPTLSCSSLTTVSIEWQIRSHLAPKITILCRKIPPRP